jgi:hypothetical protein
VVAVVTVLVVVAAVVLAMVAVTVGVVSGRLRGRRAGGEQAQREDAGGSGREGAMSGEGCARWHGCLLCPRKRKYAFPVKVRM